MKETLKKGGCHCGAVQWEARLPDEIEASECNCSICQMVGFLHVFVTREDFNLLKGEEHITEYVFNTGVAKHWFCKTCGVKSFYLPRSHPQGYSLNLRCMDRGQFRSVTVTPFDGQNWEANVDKLAKLPEGGD